MKNTKINKIEIHEYAMELSRIHFNNGASVSILDYLKINSIPCNMEKAILNKDYANIIKLIRQYNNNKSGDKKVNISYSCDVFSTVSNSWHFINEKNYLSGYYKDLNDIKKAIQHKKDANQGSIQNGLIKNLKFEYEFCFK